MDYITEAVSNFATTSAIADFSVIALIISLFTALYELVSGFMGSAE